MEAAKKTRSNKGATVTRRINELLNAVTTELAIEDINVKVKRLEDAMEELGISHDNVVAEVAEGDPSISDIDKWYYEYVQRVDNAMKKVTLLKVGMKKKNRVLWT